MRTVRVRVRREQAAAIKLAMDEVAKAQEVADAVSAGVVAGCAPTGTVVVRSDPAAGVLTLRIPEDDDAPNP